MAAIVQARCPKCGHITKEIIIVSRRQPAIYSCKCPNCDTRFPAKG
jgi:transcription elongation factor Elf1